MRHRGLASFGALAVAIALGLLDSVAVAAQAPTAAGAKGKRTPWGDPDLRASGQTVRLRPLSDPAHKPRKSFLLVDRLHRHETSMI